MREGAWTLKRGEECNKNESIRYIANPWSCAVGYFPRRITTSLLPHSTLLEIGFKASRIDGWG
jgi:hypothetical protein